MDDLINYYSFTKDEWKHFNNDSEVDLPLTSNELRHIKAFNDRISLQDVADIYKPLVHMIRLQKTILTSGRPPRPGSCERP